MDAKDTLARREAPLNNLAMPIDVLAARRWHATGWPLLSAEGNKQLETRCAAVLPAHTLMQRAGWIAARLALALAPHAHRVSVLIGPGNNGGDGLEVATHLHRWGLPVTGLLVLGPDAVDPSHHRWPDDARAALERATLAGVPIVPFAASDLAPAEAPGPDGQTQHLIIDALLGRGLRQAPAGALCAAIAWANRLTSRHDTQILAIDLPSGLSSDTGQLAAQASCIRATATLSLMGLAPGLFTAQGRDVAGQIWFHDLGVTWPEDLAPTAWLTSNAQLCETWPRRHHAQHKGSFGDVVVIGGAPGMAGAARLSARAALVGGAGRVYLATLDPASITDPVTPELMTTAAASIWAAPHAWHRATFVMGCGGGSAIEAHLPGCLTHAQRLVLDADALNALASHPDLQTELIARADRDQGSVLTPHPLEAARLLGISVSEVQADRLHAAQVLAHRYQCVVVLKGSGSIVARPDEAEPGTAPESAGTPARCSAWIIPTGNAALSTPGSGDVLAGLMGSLWSQMGNARADPSQKSRRWAALQRVSATAVALHGNIAEQLRPTGATLSASALIAGLAGRTPLDLRD